MQQSIKITQIEGVSAGLIFEAFKCLENRIKALDEKLKPTEPQNDYLTRNEVVELLKVSYVTIHDWTNKGFLKSYRLGNKVFYKRAEIDAAMVEIKKGGARNEAV
jgi:excisionase family DNA binding protein